MLAVLDFKCFVFSGPVFMDLVLKPVAPVSVNFFFFFLIYTWDQGVGGGGVGGGGGLSKIGPM